jgi:hypothetical protein
MLKQEKRENKIPVPISPCRDLRAEDVRFGTMHIFKQNRENHWLPLQKQNVSGKCLKTVQV